MSYTVLARRYRSQTFDEVVGQEPIARTLASAIEHDRLAHAYLFCGTRGVGKTSMARIFAKALNGGTEEVDRAIMTGQDTDVIEIDGASNRKVEEARELIANSVYRPLRGAYKIYIIDEVHMLTREAFNTLLKTMEEPPSHVKFILCTTEPEKVPPTIQSRCQRFDFRPIPTTRIAAHVEHVIGEEGLEAEPELVHAVARLGNGSMRDALSLLDRVMASGQSPLTLALLESLLGLPKRDLLDRLIDAVGAGDPKGALEAGGALLASGVSPEMLLETLAGRYRDLMVMAACGAETDLVDMSDEAREADAARASRFDAAGLSHLIALCESVHRSARNSAAARALVDAAIVRMALAERIADVTAIASRLSGDGSGNGAATGRQGGAPAKKR